MRRARSSSRRSAHDLGRARRRARRPRSLSRATTSLARRSSVPSNASQQRIRAGARAMPPRSTQLARDAVTPDLVEFVDRDQRRSVQRRWHARRLQQRRAAARDGSAGSTKSSNPSSLQHVADRRAQLRLDHHRPRADRVDVALEELAEPAARRPIGAPHRLDLVSLEELRQLAAVFGDDARERHGQVVAQGQVRFARTTRARRGEAP